MVGLAGWRGARVDLWACGHVGMWARGRVGASRTRNIVYVLTKLNKLRISLTIKFFHQQIIRDIVNC